MPALLEKSLRTLDNVLRSLQKSEDAAEDMKKGFRAKVKKFMTEAMEGYEDEDGAPKGKDEVRARGKKAADEYMKKRFKGHAEEATEEMRGKLGELVEDMKGKEGEEAEEMKTRHSELEEEMRGTHKELEEEAGREIEEFMDDQEAGYADRDVSKGTVAQGSAETVKGEGKSTPDQMYVDVTELLASVDRNSRRVARMQKSLVEHQEQFETKMRKSIDSLKLAMAVGLEMNKSIAEHLEKGAMTVVPRKSMVTPIEKSFAEKTGIPVAKSREAITAELVKGFEKSQGKDVNEQDISTFENFGMLTPNAKVYLTKSFGGDK